MQKVNLKSNRRDSAKLTWR